MILLTKEVHELYLNQINCHICKTKFKHKYTSDNNYRKGKEHCYYKGINRGAGHSICNVKYNIPKEIPVVFHNGSNHDYHFIIKELAKEFEGENTKKH